MQKLNEIPLVRRTEKNTSERAELIKELLEIVNQNRRENGYKNWTAQIFAIRCSPFSLDHLYAIRNGAKDRNNRGQNAAKYINFATKSY